MEMSFPKLIGDTLFKVLKKEGKVIMVGSRRVFVLFLIWGGGGGADHAMIFHTFSDLFYNRFLVSNCSKFCVKKMGSAVSQSEKGPDPSRVARATQTGLNLDLDQGRVA